VYINQCLFLNAFVDEEKRREEFYNSRGFSKLKKGMGFFLNYRRKFENIFQYMYFSDFIN